ncbi:MAG: hypothetical protein ABIV06_01660 [Thermoanaerobaculia bacterium]
MVKRSRGTHMRRLPPDPAANAVAVGEATYQWELRHGGGTWPDGTPRGLSISVWSERHQTRELILDFPHRQFGQKLPLIEDLEAALIEGIPIAIAEGWNPESRGRRFRLELEESDISFPGPAGNGRD